SVARFADRFAVLLEAICSRDAPEPVHRLSMLTAAERQSVLHDWNDTAVTLPSGATLIDLLEDAARAHGTNDAVLFEDQRLSYAELQASANRLAHYLLSQGIGQGSLVGIALPRSPEYVVAILGVMKVGAAYVPLEPTYPAERLAFMAQD